MVKDNRDLKLIESLITVKELFFNEMVKCYKKSELSSTELTIIYVLRHKNKKQKVGDLASSIFIPMSTLTGVLDKMEKKNIILRERCKVDRRSVYVTLNQEFEKESSEFLKGFSIMMEEIKEGLTEEVYNQFYETLKEMENILIMRAGKINE